MPTEERHAGCRNCGRMQPQSSLNKEGRCPTCGTSDTPDTTRDPSEVGPHGAQEEPTQGEGEGA